MRVVEKTVEGTTRWTVLDAEGKRVNTFATETEAYEAAGICSRRVTPEGGWRSHPCRKPIKQDGAIACNFHLAMDRRRQERREQEQAASVARQEASVQSHSREATLIARIAAVLGEEVNTWEVRAHYVGGYGSSPGRMDPSKFEVRYETLVKLIEKAEQA